MIRRVELAAMARAAASEGGGSSRSPRLTLAMEQALNATPDEVWAVIGDFHDMSWHPAIASQSGEGGSRPEAGRRVLHLRADAGDPTISETLTGHDPAARSYSYRITEVDPAVLPVRDYTSTLSVRDDGGKGTVEWKGAFDRAASSDEAAKAAVSGVYQAGFGALTERFGSRG